jgi:TolA-binding protein
VKRALLMLCLTLGCSAARPERFQQAQSAAERAYSAGRYDEAASHWLEAASHCDEERDCHEARYRAASSYRRGEHFEQALGLYDRLSKEEGERAPRAALEAAEMESRLGNEKRAEQRLLDAVRRHPNSGPAERALRQHLARVRQRSGPAAALSEVSRLLVELAGSELDERLRYDRARLHDESGRSAEARDAYLDTARRHPYPEGALWDDALYRAAECEERLGRARQAVAILERLLAEREQAHLSGSYERSRYAQARFKIAELYRDALGDPGRARREFRRVWDEHPTTLLRDDALFEEALIAAAGSDQEGTCAPLSLLVDGARDSRFTPCAPHLCPKLRVPDDRPCRDYILRRIQPATER